MTKSPYILFNSDIHRRLLNPEQTAWDHAKDQYLVPVTAVELPQLSSVYPLMLVKDKNTAQYRPVAVMAFKPGSNLYYSTGLWQAGFAPLKIRSYPFTLRVCNNNSAKLLIDGSCAALNDPEGEQLFDFNGEETETLQNIKPLLKELAQYEMATDQFIEILKEFDLLCEIVLSLHYSDSTSDKMGGYYGIDVQKLSKLSTEKVARLHQHNYLHTIYSLINSICQFQVMKHKYNEVNAQPIKEVLLTKA
jgi:hypothetical protein